MGRSPSKMGKIFRPETVHQIRESIRAQFTTYVNALVRPPVSPLGYLQDVLPASTLDVCTQAYGVCKEINSYAYSRISYKLSDTNVEYMMPKGFWDRQRMLPPKIGGRASYRENIINHAKELKATAQRFYDIEQVFNWFNDEASIGHLRYHWPGVINLIADENERKRVSEGPKIHCNVPSFAHVLPHIRETSGLLATMELLPKRELGRDIMTFVVSHLHSLAFLRTETNLIPTKYYAVFYENTSEDIIEF